MLLSVVERCLRVEVSPLVILYLGAKICAHHSDVFMVCCIEVYVNGGSTLYLSMKIENGILPQCFCLQNLLLLQTHLVLFRKLQSNLIALHCMQKSYKYHQLPNDGSLL